MAKFNDAPAGFVFKPTPVLKPSVKKKRKVAARWVECDACGFSEKLSTKVGRRIADQDLCPGCEKFFGGWEVGCTDYDYTSAKERMAELKEHKYGIILKSGTFGDAVSGDSLGVEFGDIFQVVRFGSERKPTGKIEWCMEAFTVDVMVNNRPLKLFLHEIAPMPWVTIMLYRKDKEYIEQYLSSDDKNGYFAPIPEVRDMIINAFGPR